MSAVWAISHTMIKELIRKKDFYVLFILTVVIMALLISQRFFNIEGITRYVSDFGYSIVMLFSFIIAVTFMAKQLPAEIGSRTIYPLLAKPISRFKVIFGKFLGGVSVAGISFTVFYFVYAGFCLAGDQGERLVLLGQGYIFGLLFLCMVTAIVLFFSTFMTMSANVTVSFLVYIAIGGFSDSLKALVTTSEGVLSALYGVLYYLIPHLEFFDLRVRITHEWDALPLGVIFAVTAYTVIYCMVLLYFAGCIFKRKKL